MILVNDRLELGSQSLMIFTGAPPAEPLLRPQGRLAFSSFFFFKKKFTINFLLYKIKLHVGVVPVNLFETGGWKSHFAKI